MKLTSPIVIAEISANHNGSLQNAKKLIYHAKKYGANLVKFQTYEPETMTLNCNRKEFIIKKGIWKNKKLWDLYKKAQTPFSWQKPLFDYAKKLKIKSFSTPFDMNAVDLLEKLNCPIYKIASFELTHLPLIKYIAETKKPIIISTGMSSIKEIDDAFNIVTKYGNKDISLLYCVSNYPASPEDFNLGKIKYLKNRYKCKIGFSDHSKDNSIATAALFAGAEIFEKHICLKNVKSPDYSFSLKGKEIMKYVNDLNNASKMIGSDTFKLSSSENSYRKLRRSIFSTKEIEKGEKFNINNIGIFRPQVGLKPKYFYFLVGKRSPIKIKKNMPINKEILKKIKYK